MGGYVIALFELVVDESFDDAGFSCAAVAHEHDLVGALADCGRCDRHSEILNKNGSCIINLPISSIPKDIVKNLLITIIILGLISCVLFTGWWMCVGGDKCRSLL